MKAFKVTIGIILFATTGVLGQRDHLEPVGGLFDVYNFQFEYYSQIRKILFEGLSEGPVARFLVLPSFTQENVLDIEEDRENKKYYIVYQEVDEMIWSNEKPDEIKLKKFKKEIDKESVDLVQTLFLKTLKLTRYPDEDTWGLDGTNYYFYARGLGLMAGTVWSPKEGTKLDRLVDIGNELSFLARSKEKEVRIEGKLKEDIEKLTAEFK